MQIVHTVTTQQRSIDISGLAHPYPISRPNSKARHVIVQLDKKLLLRLVPLCVITVAFSLHCIT